MKTRVVMFLFYVFLTTPSLALDRIPAASLPGPNADPHIACFDGTYYIYPTTDNLKWESTNFSCWSSKNLIDWKNEGLILDFEKDVKWASTKAWAPCIARKNGKFYFYFSAEQSIGVAVADEPTGPFRDPLGKPLIPRGLYQCQVIDPMVFVDDDGSAYLYFGQGNCNVVKLNEDMISFAPDAVKRITPKGYNEGAFMIKRKGTYYLMWSSYDTRDPRYSVSYATGPSPLGPFTPGKGNPILKARGGIKASGHHSVVQSPGEDKWFAAYHRFRIPGGNGYNREVCISPIRFETDGTIIPIDVYEQVKERDIPSMIGGGNISVGGDRAKMETLRDLGAGVCRIPISPGDYWRDGKASPERADAAILMAHKIGVRPMLLFEYYTRWNDALGDYEKWEEIGRAFARRFRPNSEWLRSKGVRAWGVVFFSAVNEPMWRDNNPEPIPVEIYAKAMEGLADGAHAVDPSLRFSPGGFQEVPLFQNRNPYIKALAPLYNSGKLYAIDIHRYWDIEYVPMEKGHDFSLQKQFDQVKRENGITANVRFYTTEMNFKKRNVSEEEAAQGFLTALWDALTVVDAKGEPATEFVLPWNIFNLESRDEEYGLCSVQTPWTPNARGKVLQMVCNLTKGASLKSCDPKGTGITILEGAGKKIWIWQNRPQWSSVCGPDIRLTDLPSGTAKIEVYAWNGLVKTIATSGNATIAITDLSPRQTYMFVSAASNR